MKQKRSRRNGQEGGFTLVEIALVVLISSIVMMMIARGYQQHLYDQRRTVTIDNLDMIESALREYKQRIGQFPCPARLNARTTDADYGLEQRNVLTGDCATFEVAGNRDTGADDIMLDPANDPDPVFIGAVPFATILADPDNDPTTNPIYVQLRGAHMLDAWKNKITYAVSGHLTNSTKYKFRNNFGVIDVKDENSQSVVPTTPLLDAAGNPVIDPLTGNPVMVGTAQAVLISHGENGRWAYSAEGVQANGCNGVVLPLPPSGIPLPGTSLSELENCPQSNNSVFLSGLRMMTDFQYNDDLVKYVLVRSNSLWGQGSNGDAYNTNGGMVGFGKDPENRQLDIAGSLRADDIITPELCSSNPLDPVCMNVKVFAGNEVQCDTAAGEYLKGIFDNNELCAAPVYNLPTSDVSCLADGTEYMTTITSNGGIECCKFDGSGCHPVNPP